jgi:hypothetical protein
MVQYTFDTIEELNKMKERVMKIKLIILDKMGKHPLENPSYFKQTVKNKILKGIEEYLDAKTDEEITQEFNEVCLEKLFDGECDVSNYPVYDLNNLENS